jgi:phosphohistidine phosphatase
MRHARAESFASSDQRRRLTDRGRRDAAAVGRWLAEQGLVPTHAYVSSAERTKETWQALAEASGSTADPLFDDALYAGGPDDVMESLRAAPAGAAVVLYVGHNPTVASLAHVLDDGNPEPEAFRAMSEGFPPAATAVLELQDPWTELDVASARLVDFHVGRG